MTPERLFTPPYGLSVGSAGTLTSRAGAGSRAPAGSLGRVRRASRGGFGGFGGSAGGAGSARGESARICTNACESAHGGRAQERRRAQARRERAGAHPCVGVCCCLVVHESEPVHESVKNETIVHESETSNPEPEPANNETIPHGITSEQPTTANNETIRYEPDRGAMAGRRTLQKLLWALRRLKKRGRFFGDIGFLETSKICIGFCGDITETPSVLGGA